MTFTGIYFKVIVAKPIKKVAYCCFKVRYSLQNGFPQLYGVLPSE